MISDAPQSDAVPKVEKPDSSLVTPLLTDLYQITMAYSYWKAKRCDEEAVFEVFFRKNPFGGEYTIFSGLDEVLKFLAHYRFSTEDIEYLRSTPSLEHCEPAFFDDYLANIDCSQITIRSMKQGSIVFPRLPLLIVSGPLGIAQLIETTILNLVNFPSLLTTNAARMVAAAQAYTVNGKKPACVEFGLRRAQGPDGGFTASKYSLVGGFVGTSNIAAGKSLSAPISGTHAHSYIMSFTSLDEIKVSTLNKKGSDSSVELLPLVLQARKALKLEHTNNSELAAFISYAVAYPDGFLCLVDTYNTMKSGLMNFILVALALDKLGYTPIGIRLDSGDLSSLSLACDKTFKDYAKKSGRTFFKSLKIIASNDINEESLQALNERGHAIAVFGIGTNLVTCQAQPALGCVYKMVQLNDVPRIKLSNDLVKVLIPGCKKAFRLYGGENDLAILDLMVEINEDEPKVGCSIKCCNPYETDEWVDVTPTRVEALYTVVWNKNEGIVGDIPSLDASKQIFEDEKKLFDPSVTAVSNAQPYKVSVSQKISDQLHEMWNTSLHS